MASLVNVGDHPEARRFDRGWRDRFMVEVLRIRTALTVCGGSIAIYDPAPLMIGSPRFRMIAYNETSKTLQEGARRPL